MYGDMMFCVTCNRTFKDTWVMHDTRTDKVMTNCPFCNSMNTVNASMLLWQHEETKELSDKFYNELKRKLMIFEQKQLTMKPLAKIFLKRDML